MFHFIFLLQCAKKMGSVKKPLCPLIHFVTSSLGKVSTDGSFWYTDNTCMVYRPSMYGAPLIHFVTPSSGKVCTDGSFWYTDHPCMVHRRFIFAHRRRARCVPMVHFGTPTIHVRYTVDSFCYTVVGQCVYRWFILVHRPSMYGAPSIHFYAPSSGNVCTDRSFWYTVHSFFLERFYFENAASCLTRTCPIFSEMSPIVDMMFTVFGSFEQITSHSYLQ